MGDHDIEDEVIREVSKFKAFALPALIATLAASVTTVIAKLDEINTFICSDRVELSALKAADTCKTQLHEYQLAHARDTGKMLRTDCDAELTATSQQLQSVFKVALTETTKRMREECNEKIQSCID